MKDGCELYYLIDPLTGAPSKTDIHQVTVVHEDGHMAEAYAKVVFMLGSRDGMRYAEEKGLAVCILLPDKMLESGPFVNSAVRIAVVPPRAPTSEIVYQNRIKADLIEPSWVLNRARADAPQH